MTERIPCDCVSHGGVSQGLCELRDKTGETRRLLYTPHSTTRKYTPYSPPPSLPPPLQGASRGRRGSRSHRDARVPDPAHAVCGRPGARGGPPCLRGVWWGVQGGGCRGFWYQGCAGLLGAQDLNGAGNWVGGAAAAAVVMCGHVTPHLLYPPQRPSPPLPHLHDGFTRWLRRVSWLCRRCSTSRRTPTQTTRSHRTTRWTRRPRCPPPRPLQRYERWCGQQGSGRFVAPPLLAGCISLAGANCYSCLCVMLMSPLLQYMCCNSLLGDVVSAPKSCHPKQSLNHCHCPAVQLKETLLDENARMFDVSGDAGEGEGGESPTPRSIFWSCKGASSFPTDQPGCLNTIICASRPLPPPSRPPPI